MNFPCLPKPKAFSLPELLAVIALIAVVATLTIPAFEMIRTRVEKARCIQNLRGLHVAHSNYVADKKQWPQSPYNHVDEQDKFESWWIRSLARYGAKPEMWHCPTGSRMARDLEIPEDERLKMYYTPTLFDENPFTPFRWSTQPWLMEAGNFHGKGNLLIYPDGSVITVEEAIQRTR